MIVYRSGLIALDDVQLTEKQQIDFVAAHLTLEADAEEQGGF